MRRDEARHVVRGDPRDVHGAAVYGNWDYLLRPPFGVRGFNILAFFFSDVEYQISDAAATHSFDWLVSSWSTPADYTMWWHSKGVSGSRDLTNDPSEIREARVRFDIDTTASDLWICKQVMATEGHWIMASGSSGFGPPYVKRYYLMGTDYLDAWVQGLQFGVRTTGDFDAPAVQLTPMVKPKDQHLELSLNGRSDLDQAPVNTPLSLVDPGQLTFALEPQSWFGRFLNQDNRIRLRS